MLVLGRSVDDVLDRAKATIDKATGGELTRGAETATGGGLPGVGSTVLPPVGSAGAEQLREQMRQRLAAGAH